MFFFSIDLDFVSYFPYNLGSQPKTSDSTGKHSAPFDKGVSLNPQKTAKFCNKMNYLHP